MTHLPLSNQYPLPGIRFEITPLFRTHTVPLVDILQTQLDPTLPGVAENYDEWGDPLKNKDYFEYIKGYSPYENIKKQNYPAMRVAAGFNDTRVFYWESLKWIAKLRQLRTNKETLILETNLNGGHLDYEQIDTAKDFAFILREMGMAG